MRTIPFIALALVACKGDDVELSTTDSGTTPTATPGAFDCGDFEGTELCEGWLRNTTGETAANIVVEGNDSHGILLQSGLVGGLTIDGGVSVLGDNARAIYAEQDITGDVLISGLVNARGENAQTLEFDGDIGGALTIESAVTSSGAPSRST